MERGVISGLIYLTKAARTAPAQRAGRFWVAGRQKKWPARSKPRASNPQRETRSVKVSGRASRSAFLSWAEHRFQSQPLAVASGGHGFAMPGSMPPEATHVDRGSWILAN